MADQMNLDPLYNPLLPPAPLGEAPPQPPVFAPAGGFTPDQQNLYSTLTGTKQGAVTPGYGGGGPMIAPADTSTWSNASGGFGLGPVKDKTPFIPEVKDAAELAGEEIDRQITDFEAADEIGGRGEARKAKADERKEDRLRRKAEHDKAKDEYKGKIGAPKREARRKARGRRRSERKSERKSRKTAWKTYKGKNKEE